MERRSVVVRDIGRAHVAFRSLRASANDPTTLVHGDVLWRASWTSFGPASVRIDLARLPVDVDAFGPGAECLANTVAGLLGRCDEPRRVDAEHRAVDEACRRHWETPLPRTCSPYHELLPAVLGQRVTGAEAAFQWSKICRLFGGVAPGPDVGMYLPPDPERLKTTGYVELHGLGIERRRADTLRRIASHADALLDRSRSTLRTTESLVLIDGVGPWTAAIAGRNCFGDPDAVPVGDFHLKNVVAFALLGRARGSDSEMLAALEPYAGQRGRVLWWLELDGWRAPRRGPKRRNLKVANL